MRLRNRQALFLPDIDELFRVSLKDHDDYDHVEVWGWVGAHLPDPRVGVFVARSDDKWSGIAIVSAIDEVWAKDPTVLFLYAGSPGVFGALMDEVKEFCEEFSSRVRFINGTRHKDSAYIRRIRRWCSGAPAGSLIECTWNDGGS